MGFRFCYALIFTLLLGSCHIRKHDADFWYNKGVTKVDRKKYRRALHFLDKAIKLDNTNAEYYCEKGVALDELGSYEEAIAAYTQAISLKSDYADAYYNRGNAYFDATRFQEAEKDYRKAIELNPADEDYHAMLKQTLEALIKAAD